MQSRLHKVQARVRAYTGVLIVLLGCSHHEGIDGAITSINVPPFALNPPFSTSITDYYVRCAAGNNAATLIVDYTIGETQTPMVLTPDQEISVAGQYWIRCLPPDFPVLTATSPPDAGPTPGYYLVDSLTYAFVLDTHGTPVWYARGTAVADVDSLATNTLSFAPNSTLPYGYTEADGGALSFDVDDLTNSTTTEVTTVGTPTDQHELRLLPDGDYILLSYPIETGVDLTGLNTYGSNETMADCEIEEVDSQGNLVWSWRATQHIDPVKESQEPQSNVINGVAVIDAFHCNSVDVDATGNLLLSSRHASAVYYIDKTSGTILWKLGGTAYNKDGATLIAVTGDSEGTFSMQHDVRFAPTTGHVTMYDDHGAPGAMGVARGIEYAVDVGARTATVAFQSLGSGPSLAEGSFRRYTDGHSVIAWGLVLGDPRMFTEIDENGNDVFDVTSSGGATYRAVKVPLSQLDIGLLRSTTPE